MIPTLSTLFSACAACVGGCLRRGGIFKQRRRREEKWSFQRIENIFIFPKSGIRVAKVPDLSSDTQE